MKFYLSLIKKTFKRNDKIYNLKNEALTVYLTALMSYIFTPIFIIFKIKPNTITFVNFILAILSLSLIFTIKDVYFKIAILIYFIFRVLDICDGSVARLTNQASFYGRFLDSALDIFYESFLILLIGYYCFKQHNSEELFLLGIVASIFAIFNTCIYDKYAALVRWMNAEKKTNFVPYLRKKYFARLGYTMSDLNHFLIIILLFFSQNSKVFLISAELFFLSFIFTSLVNLIKHFYSASKVLRFQAQDKKTYAKKGKVT